MAPAPGRKRTRATARLRRPVDWTSGFGISGWTSPSWSASPGSRGAPGGVRQGERAGLLGGVGMRRPGVDLQLRQLLSPERALWEHAAHRAAHELLGPLAQEDGVARLRDGARVAGVAPGEGPLGLVGGEHDLGGVDHDDVVAGVEVACEGRPVLAPQHAGDLGREAPEHDVLGVDDVPDALDLARLW